MTTNATERCPEQLPEITETQIEDEIVLFDPRVDAAHVLNPTAALVWWLCDGTRKPSAIADEVAKLYKDAPESLRDDVAQVIRDFAVAGVIRWK